MIDTITVKIPITDENKKKLKIFSKSTAKYDYTNSSLVYKIYNAEVYIPSYNRDIVIFYSEFRNDVTIQLSLPKLLLGHNVLMVFPDKYLSTLNHLRYHLQKNIGKICPIDFWKLIRIDLCYNWKLKTQIDAEKYMQVIKNFNYPKKKKQTYPFGLYLKGREHTIKFYLKHNEFKYHDYKDISKYNLRTAKKILKLSEGVVRFEVEVRSEGIKSIFNRNKVYVTDLNGYHIKKLLKTFYYKTIKNIDPQTMNDRTVIELLKKRFKRPTAIRLFQFYQLYYSNNSTHAEILRENYDRSTIDRNLKSLSSAGVGLPDNILDYEIDLSIPSEFATNVDMADVAEATQPQLFDTDDLNYNELD